MLYVTGDTHGSFLRFSKRKFPEEKEMAREDIVLIAGDFGGIWAQDRPHPLQDERTRLKMLESEKRELDVLAQKNCTFAYVLGNHENWARYDSDEFPVVDFYGGKARKVRDNVFQLMSGNIYDFDGYTVLAFGGAASHDIVEGILDRQDFPSDEEFRHAYRHWKKTKVLFRVKDFTWWEREAMPTEEEKALTWENLARHGNKVNLVLTHCLPQGVASFISHGGYKADNVSSFLDEIAHKATFDDWICGHYHREEDIWGKFHILYEKVHRLEEVTKRKDQEYFEDLWGVTDDDSRKY